MSLKICRLCLDENDLLSNIFDNQRKIQKQYTLIECIEYISNLKIKNDDKYSILICHKCNYLVEQSFCFLRHIQLSNSTLQKTDLEPCIVKTVNLDENSSEGLIEGNENVSEVGELFERLEDELSDDMAINEEYLDEYSSLIEDIDEEKDTEFLIEELTELKREVIDDEDDISLSLFSNIRHILKITDQSKMYKCEICLQLCQDSNINGILDHLTMHTNLQNWITTLNNKENLLYVCDHCQDNFNDISQLFIHLRKHLNIRPYTCHNCTSKKSCFFTESELMIHIQKQHNKLPIQMTSYTCTYCSKKLHSSTSLKLHEKRHIEAGSVKCGLCPKTFYFQSELKRHIQIHTGEKLYECDICKKRFSSQPEVNRHRKYHTNERRFKCEFCDKRFIESGHLMGHRNFVHLNKKNFECEFCSKKFLTNYKLKRHQKSRSCELVSVLKISQKPDDETIDIPTTVDLEETNLEEIDEPNNGSNFTINNLFCSEEMIHNVKDENTYSDNGNSTIINDVRPYVIDDVNAFINWDKVY